jgi:hypothetical protein
MAAPARQIGARLCGPLPLLEIGPPGVRSLRARGRARHLCGPQRCAAPGHRRADPRQQRSAPRQHQLARPAGGLDVPGARRASADEAITQDGRYLYALDADARKVFGWTVGDDDDLIPSARSRAFPRPSPVSPQADRPLPTSVGGLTWFEHPRPAVFAVMTTAARRLGRRRSRRRSLRARPGPSRRGVDLDRPRRVRGDPARVPGRPSAGNGRRAASSAIAQLGRWRRWRASMVRRATRSARDRSAPCDAELATWTSAPARCRRRGRLWVRSDNAGGEARGSWSGERPRGRALATGGWRRGRV